jgi:uncharacterized Zn finger protein
MMARTRCACRVCGSAEVDLDEVLDAALLQLASCERCGHRWTDRPLLALARPLAATEPEVAEAA